MKVIDLLNKIANGEEVPEKIKYVNIIWYFNKKDKTYYMNNTEIQLFYIEKLTNKLSDEVEIIEDTPINKLYANNELQYNLTPKEDLINHLVNDCGCVIEDTPKKIPEKIKDKYSSQISKVELAQKYNEIIDYLDYLKSKGE